GSTTKRTDAWINATYHSTNQTIGFLSFGDEVTGNFWTNSNPVNSNQDPQDGNRSLVTTPTLRIQINDTDMANQSVNTTWLSNSSGSWVQFATNSSSSNPTSRWI
ncbi:unnamed protein product, partial [marine sediment metagenome]